MFPLLTDVPIADVEQAGAVWPVTASQDPAFTHPLEVRDEATTLLNG